MRDFTYAPTKELAPERIYFAIVTIAGTVKPATAFDPDRTRKPTGHSTPNPPKAGA